MTIVYIYFSLASFGGIERILVNKANYMAEHFGYKVYIVTFEQGDHPTVYQLSPKVTHLDWGIFFYKQFQYGPAKRMLVQWQMNREFMEKLEKLVDEIQPDILISTTNELSTMEAITKLKDSSRKIIETHNNKDSIAKDCSTAGSWLKKQVYRQMNRRLNNAVRKTSMFVALTEGDARRWADIPNVTVIPNMLNRYPDTKELEAVKKKGKRVISVGRLVRQKGFDLLVKAWQGVHSKHPDWVLDIYGDGPDKERLLQEIDALQLGQSVVIHEPTSHIYERYMESDFYVMSSRWEGFGLVLTEAMACGIPCVSFACPDGPEDIIRDGEDGILAENGNTEQLAEKICLLIENGQTCHEMGTKARENVKRYLPENVMPQWRNLFESLTEKR